MSGEWISLWLEKIIRGNQGAKYGADLQDAYVHDRVMLAGVVKLYMQDKAGELRFAFQKYKPKAPGDMAPWGEE